jgi:hypothetical protein
VILKMNKNTSSRRGYAVLETLVAVALLSAATAGLVKIARVHAAIHQRNDMRLSARLAATNVIERLRGLPLERIRESLDQTQAGLPAMKILVDQQPFASEAVEGIHVIVSVHEQDPVIPATEPLAREHFWILEPIVNKSTVDGLP